MRISRAVLVVLGLLLPVVAFSQTKTTGRGNLIGTIIDPQWMPVEGANISVQPGDKITTSRASGQFSISDLPAGSYHVIISLKGYKEYGSAFTVAANQSTSLHVTLVADDQVSLWQPPLLGLFLASLGGGNFEAELR